MKKKMQKIMTSKKTTREMQKQLQLMHMLNQLRRDIEKTADKFCLKISESASQIVKCLEDK